MKVLAAKAVTTATESHKVGSVAGVAIGSAGLATFFEAIAPGLGVAASLVGLLLGLSTLVIKWRKEYRETVAFNERKKGE